MEVTKLQRKAIEYIAKLPVDKLYSAIDYLEFLAEKSEQGSPTDRLCEALSEIAQDRDGKISLKSLEEFLNELRD